MRGEEEEGKEDERQIKREVGDSHWARGQGGSIGGDNGAGACVCV